MCGRVAVVSSAEKLAQYLKVDKVLETLEEDDCNIAPSSLLPIVWCNSTKSEKTQESLLKFRFLGTARWGLVPKWAKDPQIGIKMFNARSETVATKLAYKRSFLYKRCLIPVDGFYEWETDSKSGVKQPWFIYRNDQQPLALAGLWEEGYSEVDKRRSLRTCTVITIPANDDLCGIHQRMPAQIEPAYWESWLDPKVTRNSVISEILKSSTDGLLSKHPVSLAVNNARNKSKNLFEPLNGVRSEESLIQGSFW